MNTASKQTIGWGNIVLGVLVALNAWLGWGAGWQYLWAILVFILGVWAIAAND